MSPIFYLFLIHNLFVQVFPCHHFPFSKFLLILLVFLFVCMFFFSPSLKFSPFMSCLATQSITQEGLPGATLSARTAQPYVHARTAIYIPQKA